MEYTIKLGINEISIGEAEKFDTNGNLRIKSNRFLHTKLLIPRLPADYLIRKHLIERLDEITGKKLILVTGPAGFGKTTLISMWLMKHAGGVKSCWVSLDENDNNETLFWYYIIMSMNRAITGYSDEDEIQPPALTNGSFEIMLNGIINWLSGISCDIILIIDDYHLIHNESIHESMQYFINNMPENMHIVMISRKIPAIKFARLRGHRKLLELNTKDLKLTFAEISEFLAVTMNLCLHEKEVRKLERYTEGWIAALNLTALRIKNSSNEKNYLSTLNHMNEYVVEYMTEEVYNSLETDIKDFLLKTSVLDTLNSSLCNEVVGIKNSIEIICRLEKNNTFINALDNEKVNYRYHSLFSEFLRNRLMKESPDTSTELYLNASSWYEKRNMIQEALDYSERAKDHRNTARLVEKFGEIMIINRDIIRVGSLIESLPVEYIAENARLCALYTVAVEGKNKTGENSILIAGTKVSLDSDIFRESSVEALLIRIVLACSNEDIRTALEYGNQLLSIMSGDSFIQCMAFMILWPIYCTVGNSKKVEDYLDLYINAVRRKNYFDELYIDTIYVNVKVQILCSVGKYREALENVKKFEAKLLEEKTTIPPIANSMYLNLGYIYFEFGELEFSQASVEKCIELSYIKMDIPRLIGSYVLVAKINCCLGNYSEMMTFIKRVEDLCDKSNSRLIIFFFIICIVRTLSAAGKVEYADYLISKYDVRVRESFDAEYEDVHLALADLFIVKGEFGSALGILDRLYIEMPGNDRNINHVRIMILKSLLSKCCGNEAEALRYMREALENASEQGYISTFSEFGKSVAEIIRELLNNLDEMDYRTQNALVHASSILTYIRESEDMPGDVNPELMKSLSRRELEVLDYLQYGLTNKETASKLFVAESTIKKHINNIYRKLGTENRMQTIYIYRRFMQQRKY